MWGIDGMGSRKVFGKTRPELLGCLVSSCFSATRVGGIFWGIYSGSRQGASVNHYAVLDSRTDRRWESNKFVLF